MKVSRVALRALNEYRRVSPFTYLSLRYTLQSTAAQSDLWAKEITPEILLRRDGSAYLPCRQFKQITERGKVEYRNIHFPCANEALAESALLAHCAEAGGPFNPERDVFSYHLAASSSGEGCFKAYFKLFSARQRAIGKVCKENPKDIVLFADIKSFYPSVPHTRAKFAWLNACRKAEVKSEWRILGLRLMEEQRELLKAEAKASVRKGLLVGPMFSHVLGNLVLLEFDKMMRSKYPDRYFRYVDDVALVIPRDEKDAALAFIRKKLRGIGLKLNKNKIGVLGAEQWKTATKNQSVDYDSEIHRIDDVEWMSFIDRLKCFLMANSGLAEELAKKLRDAEIRISIPHYSAFVRNSDYVDRFSKRLSSQKFRRKIADITIQSIVDEAKQTSEIYQQEFKNVWDEFHRDNSLRRKWLLSRIRYILGRLILVAPKDALVILAEQIKDHKDLSEHGAIFKALVTRDVSELVCFSGKVNAAAGQVLSTDTSPVKCYPKMWSREAVEGYVTLLLLGVNLEAEPPKRVQQQFIVRFTNGVHHRHDWLKTSNGFLQELLALSNGSSLERHRSLLQEPVDPDENWVLFADELRGMSS